MRRLLPLLLVGCAAEPAPVPDAPTWTEHVRPIYEAHCVRCHAAGEVLHHGVELDSYLAARATRHRSVCTAITADLVDGNAALLRSDAGVERCGDWEVDSMPPGTLPRLTRSEMETLLRWLELGAPE